MITKDLQEFYQAANKSKALIAIDYGRKKFGIASSTPDWGMSMPKEIIDYNNLDYLINISNLSGGVVIGLPLNLKGGDSELSVEVEKFAAKLANLIQTPIFLQDERYTSKTADNLLKERGYNRKVRNQIDDMVSAHLILSTVIDSIKNIRK